MFSVTFIVTLQSSKSGIIGAIVSNYIHILFILQANYFY